MIEFEAEQSTVKKGRYTYIHEMSKGLLEAIDVHHIIVLRSRARGLIFCTYDVLFAITCFMLLLLSLQLETYYMSGRTLRRFIPIDKILRPVLNECVTPVTCYWSLSLIIRGQKELLLVFKELYPPVSMLFPIWKALCAAPSNSEEQINLHSDSDTSIRNEVESSVI